MSDVFDVFCLQWSNGLSGKPTLSQKSLIKDEKDFSHEMKYTLVFKLTLFVYSGVDVDIRLYNKTPTRLPEALMVTFDPEVKDNFVWMMDKVGRTVDPLNVILNGSQHQHGKICREHVICGIMMHWLGHTTQWAFLGLLFWCPIVFYKSQLNWYM